MFWGLSEALDLHQEYCKALKLQQPHEYDAKKQEEANEGEQKSQTPGDVYKGEAEGEAPSAEEETDAGGDATSAVKQLNILLFGAGDPRHIIKTMAKMYRHKGSRVNFYVLDGCIEIVARNMLLLGIALENPQSFHLMRKVHLFMDVYGNALLRPASHQYLIGKAKAMLKMITDDEELKRLAPQLNIDRLRYRERDGLANAFNFLLPREAYNFNMQQYWTERVRKLLTTRYDYREGAFDWDLNMVLKDRDAAQICSQVTFILFVTIYLIFFCKIFVHRNIAIGAKRASPLLTPNMSSASRIKHSSPDWYVTARNMCIAVMLVT